jgi:hypothetical protein
MTGMADVLSLSEVSERRLGVPYRPLPIDENRRYLPGDKDQLEVPRAPRTATRCAGAMQTVSPTCKLAIATQSCAHERRRIYFAVISLPSIDPRQAESPQ